MLTPNAPIKRTPEEREKIAATIEAVAARVRTAEVVDAGITIDNPKTNGIAGGHIPFTQITVWWG